MKLTIAFSVWCIVTLFLALSLVGWVVLIREDYNCKNYQGEEGESAWMKIGKSLLNKI